MACTVISLIVFAVCHAKYAFAELKDETQLGNAMSKAFAPTGQMPHLSGSVLADPATIAAPENAGVAKGWRRPVHEAPSSNQFGSILPMGEHYSHLRARMQTMPRADANEYQYGFGFVSLMGLMGLVAGAGIAAVQKYLAHGQRASQSTVDSQISLPLRSRPIVASAASEEKFTLADLKDLAKKLNPVIGYYDPLGLSRMEFWSQSNEATIGFLRHAEIKHGRAAMAGFIGYIVHENHIHWPWPMGGPDYSVYEGLSAPAVWDKIPDVAKTQIILAIGIFEIWSESRFVLEKEGKKHYMRGGKPGAFPTFDEIVHPVPFNLYDPLKLNRKKSEEWKAEKLCAEINNGRLAMLGLMGFLCEARTPGSVPLLKGMILPYDGDVMAPYGAWM